MMRRDWDIKYRFIEGITNLLYQGIDIFHKISKIMYL